MHKEIEIKVIDIDRDALRVSLEKLGARRVMEPTFLKEVFWESTGGKSSYSCFRLRQEGAKCFLTLKMNVEDERFKVREEHQVEVADFDEMKRILELAGFRIFRRREKIREEFRLGDVTVDVDEYPGMKPYFEIEGPDGETIERVLEQLGFTMADATNATAADVIKAAGLNPDLLVF